MISSDHISAKKHIVGVSLSGTWHQKDAAFKFVEFDINASDQYHRKGLDQNIAEFTTQLNAEGSGILLPWAFCRQQTQYTGK